MSGYQAPYREYVRLIFSAIPDLHEGQLALCGGVDEDGGDDQRAEIVSLAGFIDADAFDGGVQCLVSHGQMTQAGCGKLLWHNAIHWSAHLGQQKN